MRGVRGAGFDTPTQDNLEALFGTMLQFTLNYLKIYYSSNATGAGSVRSDQQVMAWLEELNKRVPKEVGVTPDRCHAGHVGAAPGESAVPGDSATRDPRQLHVELSAVDAPPAAANIQKL